MKYGIRNRAAAFTSSVVKSECVPIWRGLTQKQIATRLSVCCDSVGSWENGDNQPADAPTLRRIIHFLGYDPVPAGTTIPELLQAKRRALSMQEMMRVRWKQNARVRRGR